MDQKTIVPKMTWFGKFTDVVNEIPSDKQWWFAQKIIEYGAYGIDPEFDFPYSMAFAAIKEDIDNSNKRREASRGNGCRGGRPRKETSTLSDFEAEEPGGSQAADKQDEDANDVLVSEGGDVHEWAVAEVLEPRTIDLRSGLLGEPAAELASRAQEEKDRFCAEGQLTTQDPVAFENRSVIEEPNEARRNLKNLGADKKPIETTMPVQSSSDHTKHKTLSLGARSDGRKNDPPYEQVIGYLNAKTGASYRPSTESYRKLIRARWRKNYTLEDFCAVIDCKCKQWLGTERAKYLRPETLFADGHFDSYLNEARISNGKEPEEVSQHVQKYASTWR